MVPSAAITVPRMPVSSSTSRTAASSRGLALLDVALGQRPEQPAAPVDAPDERHLRPGARPVDDQPAGRGLLDLAQARAARPRGRRGGRRAGGVRESRASLDRSQPRPPPPVRREARRPRDVPCLPCPSRRPPPATTCRRPSAGWSPSCCGVAPVFDELGASGSRPPATSWPWSAARCATSCSAARRRTSTSPPTPGPSRSRALLRGWADAWWEVGAAFGTVGAPQGRRTSSRSRPTATRSTTATRASPR